MTIQALCRHYDILVKDETADIPRWGYSKAEVSIAIVISEAGKLSHIVDLRVGDTKTRPRSMNVPLQASRSGKNPPPYFACDKVKYVFGVEKLKKEDFKKKFKPPAEGKPTEYTILEENDKEVTLVSPSSREYFEAFKPLQHRILDGVNDPCAIGYLAFLDEWDPEKFLENPKTQQYKDLLLDGGICVFKCENDYLHQNSKIKTAWENYYNAGTEGKIVVQCLISGEVASIARVHQQIKGVFGAQSSGASIVSFNDDAFCSYGKTQSFNSPISDSVMFKYTTAINYLLKSESNRARVGDTTVVFWADAEKNSGEDYMKILLNSWETETAEEETAEDSLVQDRSKIRRIGNILEKVRLGKHVDKNDIEVDPKTHFYILGLSPNNARLAIRFWYVNTIGHFIETMARHHLDMQIIRDDYDSYYPPYISVYHLLNETLPKNRKKDDSKKIAPPLLGGLLVNSILSNSVYPIPLYSAIINRIKIEGSRNLNCVRAGFIKAYLLRLSRAGSYNVKEDLITVSLNEESSSVPYSLGRLFAVLEKLQATTNKTMNTTISDRYFSSAASTPAVVFPIVLKLSQHHLEKLESKGLRFWYKELIQDILCDVNEFPASLNLEDQGMFMLGYYHQFKDMFTKKEAPEDAVSGTEEASKEE